MVERADMTKMTADLHEAVIVIARGAGHANMAVYEGAFDVQRARRPKSFVWRSDHLNLRLRPSTQARVRLQYSPARSSYAHTGRKSLDARTRHPREAEAIRAAC